MWRKIFFKNISIYLGLINQSLSEEFKLKPLRNYFKIIGGFAFKSQDYKHDGVPVIRISDFQNEEVVLDNVRYYDESEELEKYELHAGDIIIAMTGGTIGKLAIVKEGLGKLYLNQRVGKFEIIDPSIFFEKYVYWIARGVQEKVKSLAWGAAQPNVSNKKIESMEFPIPSIEIQKKIVQFLSDFEFEALEEKFYFNESIEKKILKIQSKSIKIEELQNEIDIQKKILHKMKKSILQEAIQGNLSKDWREENQDIEPASVLLEKIKVEKEQLIKEKKIKKSKTSAAISEKVLPFDIPDSWERVYLQDVSINIHYGFNASANPDKKEVRLLRITDIQNNKVNWDTVPGCEFEEKNIKTYSLNNDDILIARTGGTIGKSYIVKNLNVVSLFASYLIRVIPSSIINANFLKLFIESPYYWKQLHDAAWGAGQPNVNGTALSQLLLGLPPLEEQKEIVKKIESLMQKCKLLEEEIKISEANAEMLMQSVLQEAFDNQ